MTVVEEGDLVRDSRNIEILQDSLQKSTECCQEMLKYLNGFESRVSAMEHSLMPLYRNISTLSRVHHNVETCKGVIRVLGEANEVAKREELLLVGGPTLDNLEGYCGSMEKVQQTIKMLINNNLEFCKESAQKLALNSLSLKYKDWLEEASAIAQSSIDGTFQSGALIDGMKLISDWVEGPNGDVDTVKELISHYVTVRSQYISNEIKGILSSSSSTLFTSTTTSSSSPIVSIFSTFIKAANREIKCSLQVLPLVSAHDAAKRSLKDPVDLIHRSVRSLAETIHQGITKKEHVEWMIIFDWVQKCNDMLVSYSTSDSTSHVREISLSIEPSLKILISAAIELLTNILDEVMMASRAPLPSLQPPSNATVSEMTSSVLNCLRNLKVYDHILEALLSHWSQSGWDGLLRRVIVADTDAADQTEFTPFALAHYYQNVLKGLEVFLERSVQCYRKPVNGALFLLNNNNYIVQTLLLNSSTASLLTLEMEQKYSTVVETLTKDYLIHWQNIIEILSVNNAMSAKERLKTFMADFEELVRQQEACSVPDTSLRNNLILAVRGVIYPVYLTFYNQNQSTFTAASSTFHHTRTMDPEQLETFLTRLFSA